jgi:DNA-binding CsgD family transcriptional regulator
VPNVPSVSRRTLGLDSFSNRAWRRAYAELSAADQNGELGASDLELLASTAFLIGLDEEGTAALTRAHHAYASVGDTEDAARAAFWLGFRHMGRAEAARANGWFARAARLLEDAGCDECVVHGYLLVSAGIRHAREGNIDQARVDFDSAADIGWRLRAGELVVFARLGVGRTLIANGRVREGGELLDEVMVGVTGGDVAPENVGVVYCVALETCDEAFDLARAREWTEAFGQWCDSEPDVVLHRGECLVRHAEIMQMRGDWSDAMAEVARACAGLDDARTTPAIGAAFYRRGELHRLRGEFDEAEVAYSKASLHGREPQPGLALLRLAQGQRSSAVGAIRRALDETHRPDRRCQLLRARVDIALAVGDVTGARDAAAELANVAQGVDASLLRAFAAHATGTVLVADGQARAALVALREASDMWRSLDAPYEVARVRALLATAHHLLGDDDTAKLELSAARQVFARLGAAPDLAHVEEELTEIERANSVGRESPLTDREVEVLGLVATGKTNRAVGEALGISEKTVARHVSNIFGKLGLSNRAEAAAYGLQRARLTNGEGAKPRR